VRTPDFEELVGGAIPPDERERLRRVHDLLVAAGPPAALTPALQSPPVRAFTRRRVAALALAAALAVMAAFGAGWALRSGDDDFDVRRAVPMKSTADAPTGASVLIELGYPDESGNWEMLVHARGLKPLPEGGYYVLLLTKDGEPVATCGSFKVDPDGATTVRLGASYALDEFDGWIVRPYVHDRDRLNETTYLTART
jgi:hypothetical protein